MCEADSTTCTESNSTVCYEESDSDNDSLSSQPMFMEDTHDTDDDDELPHIESAKVEGPWGHSSSSQSSRSRCMSHAF